MSEEDRPRDVQRFREEFGASRVHILTLYTPFQAHMSRFAFVEREAGAMLVTCASCPLRAPLERGEPQPISPEQAAGFVRAVEALNVASLDDYYPEGAHDGVTIIYERATAGSYHMVHMLQPPANSPYAKLIGAWANAFPVVRQALR